jgi:GNAT superfamily N-acetyltransferase
MLVARTLEAVEESEVRGAVIRRAGYDDIQALVRLRACMFEGMGVPHGADAPPWRAAAADWFGEVLAQPHAFAAFVADDAVDGVVSMAAGICHRSAPGPNSPLGVTGHVFNVATLPEHRRQGLSRRCLVALLDWFDHDTDAARVDLNATSTGADLYRSLGFLEHEYPMMRRRRHRPSAR